MKTKSFHWHMSGPDYREYHVLLEERAVQLLATANAITRRMHQMNGTDNRPTGHDRASNDDDVEFVTPEDVFVQLRIDNQMLTGSLRSVCALCQRCSDIVTGSLIDVWIDEARRRAQSLFEAVRDPNLDAW